MDKSPLGRLPPELRNTIYELVLTQPNTVYIDIDDADDNPPNALTRKIPTEHPFALAQTCRQAHNEVGQLFFALNTFSTNLLNTKHLFEDDSVDKVTTVLESFLTRIRVKLSCTRIKLHVLVGYFGPDSFEKLATAVIEVLAQLHTLAREHLCRSLKADLGFFLSANESECLQITCSINASTIEDDLMGFLTVLQVKTAPGPMQLDAEAFEQVKGTVDKIVKALSLP